MTDLMITMPRRPGRQMLIWRLAHQRNDPAALKAAIEQMAERAAAARGQR